MVQQQKKQKVSFNNTGGTAVQKQIGIATGMPKLDTLKATMTNGSSTKTTPRLQGDPRLVEQKAALQTSPATKEALQSYLQ